LRIAAVNFLQNVEPVAVRQADVQQQEIERMLFELARPDSPVSALETP